MANNKDVGTVGFIMIAASLFFILASDGPRGRDPLPPLLPIAVLLALVTGIVLCIKGVRRRPRSKLAIAGLTLLGLFILLLVFALRQFWLHI